MTITLYKITDDKRQLTKTLNASNKVAELTAHIKEDSSVMQITLDVHYQSGLLTANYIYISDFGRYYYVRDMIVSRQRLIITANIDVLMTYRDDIKKLRCVIERQENKSNAKLYLPDGMFRATARQAISTPYIFDQGFSKSESIVLTTGGQS